MAPSEFSGVLKSCLWQHCCICPLLRNELLGRGRGGGCTDRNRKIIDKLARRSGSILGCPLESVTVANVEDVTEIHHGQSSSSSFSPWDHGSAEEFIQSQTLTSHCRKQSFCRSFFLSATRLYNPSQTLDTWFFIILFIVLCFLLCAVF